MDAESLLTLHPAPLSSLGFTVTVIDKFIAQIDTNLFLLLTKYGTNLSVLPEPVIHSVAWAVSVGALRRVVHMEVESDEGIIASPPSSLVFGGSPAYGQIQRECQVRWPSSNLETASYRIASDGKFVCRYIETPAASFHFRSPIYDNNEFPFLVKRRLSKC
jgi:hypothetical protein